MRQFPEGPMEKAESIKKSPPDAPPEPATQGSRGIGAILAAEGMERELPSFHKKRGARTTVRAPLHMLLLSPGSPRLLPILLAFVYAAVEVLQNLAGNMHERLDKGQKVDH